MKGISRYDIKASFDTMPAGIVFFRKNGISALCNLTMQDIFRSITGRDLQTEGELAEVIQQRKESEQACWKGDILILSDQRAYRFSSRQVTTRYGETYTAYLASDVTDLKNTGDELQEKNHALAQLYEELKTITDNTESIARSQEILDIKMKIHGELGSALLYTRKYYEREDRSGWKKEFIEKWQDTLAFLQSAGKEEKPLNVLDEIERIASRMGVTVIKEGNIPQDTVFYGLVVSALRESLTNTIRHAQGDRIRVVFQESEEEYMCEITNNGIPPAAKIQEGGGLSALRRKVEDNHAVMTIESIPVYKLIIRKGKLKL